MCAHDARDRARDVRPVLDRLAAVPYRVYVSDRDDLMRPIEAARTLAISRRTLSEWAVAGLLPYRETPGGHRRYPREAVMTLAARLDHREVELPEHLLNR